MRNSTNLNQLPSGNYVFSEVKWIGLVLSLFLLLTINYNPANAQCNVSVTVQKLSNFNGADVSCFGSDDGSIKAMPLGGATLNYQYAWATNTSETSPGNSQVWYNLSAGTYTVTVTDILGCTAVGSVTLTNPADLVINSWLEADVTCPLSADGSITAINVSGGTQDNQDTYYYTFIKEAGVTDIILQNPNNNEYMTGLSGGTYYLNVSDANNCQETATITIAEDAPMSLSPAFTLTHPTCFGYTNGEIAGGVVTGGDGGYSYNWYKNGNLAGVTTADISNVGAGLYTIEVTDAADCTAEFDYTLTEPAAIVANVALVSGITCNGADNGSLTVNITPAGTYTTLWTGPNGFSDNTATITNLVPGAYTVAVNSTAAGNCPATGSVSGSAVLPVDWTYTNTGTSHTFYIAAANYGMIGGTQPIAAGDYLAAFAGNLCVGYTVVGADNTVLSAWMDDATTLDLDGFQSSDLVTFRLFRSLVGEFTTEAFGFVPTPGTVTDGTYEADGASILSSLSFSDVYPTSNIAYNLVEPAVLSASGVVTNITCNNANDGSVDLSVTGGTSPYSYAWSNTANTQDLSNLVAGTYAVTVTDANSCTTTVGGLTVANPPVLAFNGGGALTQVSCFGGSNGAIATVNVTGGTGSYTYEWSNGSTTTSLSGLVAGTYGLTVKDANLCSINTSYIITEPAAALSVSGLTTNLVCNNVSAGAINITASNGTAPYTYLWSNTSVQEDLTALAAGNYTVTVTDNNGCTVTESFTITQPSALVISNAILSDYNNYNVSCVNGTDGEIEVFATGGTGAYSYLWSTNAVTAKVTGLSPNVSYEVTITDANGCTVTSLYDLTDPDAISILPSLTHINCNGASTGAINITVSGGIEQTYTYTWSNTAATEDISGLASGNYSVSVEDANGCTASGSYTLNQPNAIVINETISDYNGYEIECGGGNDGSVSLSVSGGTAPYTYAWSSGQTVSAVNNFTVGTYTVTVTDAYGCTATDTYTLDEPTPMIVQVSPLPVSCNAGLDGVVNVTITNAVGSKTVAWTGGSTNLDVNTNSYSITGLAAGTYTVTVTDQNNCVAGSTVPATPTWNDPSNTGYSHTMAVPTSGSFEIAPGIPVAAGDYLGVFFTDGANEVCGGYIPWDGVNNAFTIWGDDDLTPLVKEGFASLEAFSWKVFRPYVGEFDATVTYEPIGSLGISSDNGLFVDGAASAVVTMNTAVQYGTINITTAVVVQPDLLTVSLDADPIQCNNGVTDVTTSVIGGNGGYTYLWGNSETSASLTGVGFGTYDITVTDSKSCTAIATLPVSNPTVIDVTVNTTDALCYGDNTGTASATAIGGYTLDGYTINWGVNMDEDFLYAGSYTVTITDDQGCTATEDYTIGQPMDLTIAETLTNIDCNAASTGAISLIVNGGTAPYDYTWSHDNLLNTANLVNLPIGTYTVTVEDAHGCTEVETYTLTEPAVLSITSGVISDHNGYSVSCFGSDNGTIDLTISGGVEPYVYLWSNNTTSQDAIELVAGDYTVTVTDANSCTVVSNVYSLTQPAALGATAAPTTSYPINGGPFNTTCNSMDGAASVSVNGGVTNYSYSWSNAATTAAISDLAGGTYTVTITDANQCTIVTSTTLTSPGPQNVTATVTSDYNGYSVSCFNGSNGNVEVEWTGGVGDFDVYWVNWANNSNLGIVANSITVTTFPAGNGYYAVVVDNNGCAAISNTVSLTSPSEITLPVVSAYPPVCHDGTNGYIDISLTSGGVSPFTASWFFTLPTQGYTLPLIGTPSNGGLVVNNVYADLTYYGQITDNNGCSKLISVTTTNISEISVSNIVVDDVDCFGAATGIITADVTGGHTGYTFSTTENGIYTQTEVNGLIAGTYDLWVQDAQGCKVVTNNIDIVENTQIVPTETITNVSCNGGSDGSIDIVTLGGVGPYTYLWDYQAITTDDLTQMPAGTYHLTITDALNCSRNFTYTITEPVVLAISGTSTDISCFNGSNGTIDVAVTGGTLPYTYSWSNTAANEDLAGLTFGTYTVDVVDAKGCTVTDTYILTQPNDYSYAASVVTNVDCNGNATGAINFDITGGTAPYAAYEWSNTAVTEDITALVAGVYTVTFEDANSCAGTYTFTVTQPLVLTADAVGTDITCNNYNDGEIAVAVAGGTTPYTHEWLDDALASLDRSSLLAGTYTVVVTDANGCTVSDVVTITNPAAIVLSSATTPVSCNAGTDGTLEVSIVSGGVAPFTYAWDGSASIAGLATGLGAGTTYAVTVTDDGGCFASLSNLVVVEPAELTAIVNVTPESCVDTDNGSALAIVNGGNGGYSYSWTLDGTDQLLIDIAPGTYTLTVTDSKLCAVSVEYTIDPAVALVLTMSSTNAGCDNTNTGSASVLAEGGNGIYTYLWNNTITTALNNNIGVGNYNVVVTDGLGCTAQGATSVGSDFDFNYVGFVSNPVSCFEGSNGSLAVNFDSNQPEHYSFQWFDAGNNAIGAGIQNQYTATLSNAVAGNYKLMAYAYPLIIGCSQEYNFTIAEPADLTLSAAITDALCYKAENGSIDLTVNGGTPGYTYQWIKGASYVSFNQDPTGLRAATYKVYVTDANGCTTEGQYIVEDPDFLTSSNVATNISCFGSNDGTINLTVIGGTSPFTYNWTGGITTQDLSNLDNGIYTVTITDNNGCTSVSNVTITEPALLEVSDIAQLIENCNEVRLEATVAGGTMPYAFTWADNINYAPILSVNEYIEFVGSGTRYLRVVDGNGCIATANEVVTLANALSITATQVPNQLAASTVVNGGTPTYIYNWSHGPAGQIYSAVAGLSVGTTYTVTVSDTYGCTATDDVTIAAIQPGQDNEVVETDGYLQVTDLNNALVSVYPNPSYNGYFTVQVENLDLTSSTIQVVDALGRSIQFEVSKHNMQLEIQLPATVGVYYLQIVTEDRTVITKQLIISE